MQAACASSSSHQALRSATRCARRRWPQERHGVGCGWQHPADPSSLQAALPRMRGGTSPRQRAGGDGGW
eukprot:1413386-Prymnesium_polylepis.1